MTLKSLKKVLQTVLRYAGRSAWQYMIYSILAAILVPVNVLLIERCIYRMEQSSGQGYAAVMFWLLLLAAGTLCAVWLEHKCRVVDVKLSQDLMRSCTPHLVEKFVRMSIMKIRRQRIPYHAWDRTLQEQLPGSLRK